MLPAVFLAALATDALPVRLEVEQVRVWPSEPATTPAALEEGYPRPDVALGVHAGVHRLALDGCWRQHAALGGDLDLWFCADVSINKKGLTKAKVTELSDPRPGLETCLETTLRTWQGPAGQPVKAVVCRQVRSHISESARTVWSEDVWAELAVPGASGEIGQAPEHKVGRPKVEGAQVLADDPQTGDLRRTPSAVGLRDRSATTARRLLSAQSAALARCWADRAGFRVPQTPSEAAARLVYTLEVTVGPSGPLRVEAGSAMPVSHLDVAQCAAAALDPDLPASAGDVVIEVPVLVEPAAD